MSLQGDQVVLDVDEVINRVKERLVARGLTIVENVPIPETDRQIVLMDAPQLRQLRTIYAFGNPVAKWLLPLVGVLYLAAFVLARRRPRMTVWIGAVVGGQRVLLALVLSVGQQLFVNELAGTAFGPASRVFYDTLLAYLERGQEVVLWLGLILVVAGWFAGANKYGTAVRTHPVRWSGEHRRRLAESRSARRPLGRGQRGLAAGGRGRARRRRPALGQQHLHGTALVVPGTGAGPARDPPDPGRRRPCSKRGRTRRLHQKPLPARSASGQGCTTKPRPGPKASSDMADIIDLMLATGARIAEILAVRWVDVALDADRLNRAGIDGGSQPTEG